MNHREPPDIAFVDAVQRMVPASRRDLHLASRPGSALSGARALELFDAQITSRHLDFAARWLKSEGAGFYTIGSAGHEGNAAVAGVSTAADPALLHYRSGAFYLERARQGRATNAIRDVLLGVVAAAEEPISGGRHKVFGSRALEIIPQTSTIASHLPRAVGLAFAIERAKKLGVAAAYAPPAIVIASFGDASANHSTLVGAVQSACHCAHQQLPMPILFVCEDNGLGISVETPPEWIAASYAGKKDLAYFAADGCDLAAAFDAAVLATRHVRTTRRPAFLHLRMVRLMGHAGSDAETAYRAPERIREDLARDPLVLSARMIVQAGFCTPIELIERYEITRRRVMETAREVAGRAKLLHAHEVMAPLAPRDPERVLFEASRPPDGAVRLAANDGKLPEDAGAVTLSVAINRTLADLCVKYPELLVFGEDVARKGGVYGVTKGLHKRFGAARVFDTLLDEQSILGLALGTSLAGFLPVAEIQYLAYLHNAEDQLRGEAATLQFFSNGAYKNPLVVRIAGYGYQKGFGGHFHNDDAVAVLRDIPGLVVASPALPDDAAAMLRTCVAAAKIDGTVSVFLEPIALYHTRDLHHDGDAGWLAAYAPPHDWAQVHAALGRGRTHGSGLDLTMVTFGNGLFMSLRVARRLAQDGIRARVLDLRWLAPMPVEDLLREAEATGKVLVVDETRRSGGVSEGVLAALVDAKYSGQMARVTSQDSFVPLGDAALTVLLSEQTIEEAARAIVADSARPLRP